MSYARQAEDCDVYVYPTNQGDRAGALCSGCGFFTTSRTDMILHLSTRHIGQGQKVPLRVFDRLDDEAEEYGDGFGEGPW